MVNQDDFEARFARWQESYQKHLQLLAYFHRWKEGHEQQQALWEYHHGPFHQLRKDVAHLKQETSRKQADYPEGL